MPRKYKRKNAYKKYAQSSFRLAIESVNSGLYSIRESAKKFAIPYSTLNAHINGENLYDRVGRPTKFSKEEEDHLEQAALLLQSWGVPLAIDEFMTLAKQYATSLDKIHLFPSGAPTYDWLYSFLNRHNKLVLKKAHPLEKKRAAITSEQVDNWFQLLNKIIQENDLDLADRPAQIFNCDESGMSDEMSYSKVIVHRSTSNAYRMQGGTGGKSYTSVMFCGSATGFLLPPFIIYKSKRLFDEWCLGGPSDAGYDCSDNGWMNQALFYRWFDQIFLKHTKDLPRPLLLIVDGHDSHFDVETLKLAVENNVIILCLPSNSTHILRPLDVVFFNSLKMQWKKILRDEYTRTNFKSINKAKFPLLLKRMWTNDPVGTKTNIVKSFMKTGIFPFNPASIDRSRILKNNTNVNKSIPHISTGSANDKQSSEIQCLSSHQTLSSSIVTSEQAIVILDQVLEDTKSHSSDIEDINDCSDDSDDEKNDDDDYNNDDEYLPPKSSPFTALISSSSRRQNTVPMNKSTNNHPSAVLPQRKTTKRKRPSISGFDSSEEDDYESVSSSTPKSHQSSIYQHEVQPRKTLPSKKLQSTTSNQQNKRVKSTLKNVSFHTSNENGITSNASSSLQAVTNAIQTVFSMQSNDSSKQTSKRTIINRSEGRVITEKDVIHQLEERKSKQNSKQSRSKNQVAKQSKRRKTIKQ